MRYREAASVLVSESAAVRRKATGSAVRGRSIDSFELTAQAVKIGRHWHWQPEPEPDSEAEQL